MDGEHHISTLHAVMSGTATDDTRIAVKQAIRTICCENGIEHATIELETPGEACSLTHCSPERW